MQKLGCKLFTDMGGFSKAPDRYPFSLGSQFGVDLGNLGEAFLAGGLFGAGNKRELVTMQANECLSDMNVLAGLSGKPPT